MKINSLILLVIMFALVFSCKEKQLNKKEVKKIEKDILSKEKINQNAQNLKEQKILIKKALENADRITDSEENMNEIARSYKKKDTTYWIEGAEEINTKEKIIYYGKSYHDKNNLSLVTLHAYRFSHKEEKDYDVIKDTFFFKNNKIYFWKNKQATKEELQKKEKEILAIKKEIDSVMEW